MKGLLVKLQGQDLNWVRPLNFITETETHTHCTFVKIWLKTNQVEAGTENIQPSEDTETAVKDIHSLSGKIGAIILFCIVAQFSMK